MQKRERLDSVRQAIADPPDVHFADPVYGLQPKDGVWRTDEDCYEFLAEYCEPGMRTIETGLGISTVLFTQWSCEHTCIVPWKIEYDRLVPYLARRGISDALLTVEIGYSDEVLPALAQTALDIVFIDGGHGFPAAIIDWYYAARRLRQGGILLLDDLHLRSVTAGLLEFLDSDPRWTSLAKTAKWAAWRRESEGPLREEWVAQPFIAPYERAS